MLPNDGMSSRTPAVTVRLSLRPPFVLHVAAAVPDLQRLDRLVQPGDVHVAHLEAAQRHRRGRPVRVGQEAVGVGVEVGQRVVDVRALLAAVEERRSPTRTAEACRRTSACGWLPNFVKLSWSWNVL